MEFDNKVIKVKNSEHGKKVGDYLKNKGVETRDHRFTCTEEDRDAFIYYGVVDGTFNNYKEDIFIQKYYVEEVFLPEKDNYPKFMLVSNHPNNTPIKRMVFMEKNGQYIALRNADTEKAVAKTIETSSWNYAEDIPEEPQLVHLTLKDISEGKGVGIDPSLIRIKE